MVDEFQDIDVLQFWLMEVLCAHHKNLFIVDDPDQTIYTLRGADVRYLRELDRHFQPTQTIDHLKMGLIRSGNTALPPEDDDALTDYLWSVVREIIKTTVENDQNLIIEGCYIPFDWRQHFSEQYLQSIRFICLAMTDAYIDAHFCEIKTHSSDIESRLNDSYCTIDSGKANNRICIDEFQSAGEKKVLIDSDYNRVLTDRLA